MNYMGIDTNVLVRFIVQDVPEQHLKAVEYMNKNCTYENPGFINHIVLCELSWILLRGYNYSKEQFIKVLQIMLITQELSIQQSSSVWNALEHVLNFINRLQTANFILYCVKKPRRTFQVCLRFLPYSK